jgi:AcrR family transcriptional regulator
VWVANIVADGSRAIFDGSI